MVWALLGAIWLAQASLRAEPAGVALLFDPGIGDHRAFVETLTRLDGSVFPVPLGEPWMAAHPPRVVVGLGPAADAEAGLRWPSIPRGRLLLWGIPPESPRGPELVGTLHPDPQCTADVLRSLAPRGWTVVAAEADEGAERLASALGAELVRGDASFAHRTLVERGATRVWLRADPSFAPVAWLRALATWSRAPGVYVGTDAPGLAELGLAHPVGIDPAALARITARWLTSVRRAPRAGRTSVEGPCKAK